MTFDKRCRLFSSLLDYAYGTNDTDDKNIDIPKDKEKLAQHIEQQLKSSNGNYI